MIKVLSMFNFPLFLATVLHHIDIMKSEGRSHSSDELDSTCQRRSSDKKSLLKFSSVIIRLFFACERLPVTLFYSKALNTECKLSHLLVNQYLVSLATVNETDL